jgi:pimeloyl-ACP methyl ester carboxylesterase
MSPTPAYSLFEKEREFTVSDGTPIRYTLRGAGDGPTVVLANGWSAARTRSRRPPSSATCTTSSPTASW